MESHPDLHFGALAIQNGFASPSDIDLALQDQKNVAPLKLGEILETRGRLTRAQITSLLETQTRLRESAAGPAAPVLFEEILPAVLTQESGPAISVNDQPLSAPRTLKSGDRLRAGDLTLTFTGDAIEIRPKAAAPVETPATPPKAGAANRILPFLRAVDGLIAKIPPTSIHTQRKYVILAAAIGALAFMLPWRIAANGNSVLGIQGPGWLSFLLALIPIAITLISRPGEPFTKMERIVASAAAGLALLIGIAKVLFPPSYATGRGIGLWLTLISGAALLAAGLLPRAGGSGAAGESTTLGARLWKKLAGLAGSVSGRRAKDLNAAIEQRDGLLRKIGEAALAAHPALPETAAAVQARDVLQAAEKELAAAATVKSKAGQKAADAKAKRAFGKLVQKALEQGLPLAGQETAIAELRAAEARIKELG